VLRFFGLCAVPRGGALLFFLSIMLSIIPLISHPRLRLGGFLMTAAPNRGGQNDKTFWKKIRPPPRAGCGDFFSKTRRARSWRSDRLFRNLCSKSPVERMGKRKQHLKRIIKWPQKILGIRAMRMRCPDHQVFYNAGKRLTKEAAGPAHL
jgi:hypothetical protein